MEYEKKYKAALERASNIHKDAVEMENSIVTKTCEVIFPELKEPEDERVRKSLIDLVINYGDRYGNKQNMLSWLEKQGERSIGNKEDKQKDLNYPYVTGWRKNYKDNKPKVKHSVLMFTTHGVAEGEWLGEEWCQYRWSCKIKDEDVLYWLHISDLENLERQDAQKPFDYENANIQQKDFAPKSAMEAIKEEKVDNANKVEPKDYSSIDPNFGKSVDKVEPKFHAGNHVIDNCGYVWRIEGVTNRFYILEGIDGGESRPTIEWVNKTFHLWDIKDAKDGDVLVASDGSIFLFKDTIDCACRHYAALTTDGVIKFNEGLEHYWETSRAVHPSTKEQREQLEKAMADAGFTFDFEKKEVKKIEQKYAWSEEEPIQEIEPFEAEHGKYYYCIKDYFCGGRKQASKGDVVQALRGLPIMGLKNASEYFLPVNLIKNNATWSEEDEINYNYVLSACRDYAEANGYADTETHKEINNWLKSLKDRIQPKQE